MIDVREESVQRIRNAFSFSNVVAVLALFLALGGSVYAASSKSKINGARIKPKSLPGNRVKARSLSGSQLKPGTLTGAQVKTGSLTGKQVVGSSLTGVAAASLGSVYYSVAKITIDGYSTASATAACPPGQKVIGGGAVFGDDGFAYVSASGPTEDRNGWQATGHSGEDRIQLLVTAICTAVTTPGGSSGAVTSIPPRYR